MLVHKYVDEKSSAAMLAAKRSTGVVAPQGISGNIHHVRLCPVQIRMLILAIQRRNQQKST